ncbi:MAG: hypothetical protein OEW15_05995 [Nitrospirota bacterium]|nr:hypothetical protein [Nitrospirota bacterium]
MRNDLKSGFKPGCGEVLERFFCKLFDDMIVKEVCLLRRQELNNRDKFSCTGCSKDTLISQTRGGLNLCSITD